VVVAAPRARARRWQHDPSAVEVDTEAISTFGAAAGG
jgi:hypothetical protein